MRITVLGAGTLQPTSERGCPGYLVEIGNKKILLDAGSGTLRQLARCRYRAGEIDYIFFTHLHPDHTGDMIPLLFAKKYDDSVNPNDILIYGPSGFKAHFDALYDIYREWISSERYSIQIQEYNTGRLEFPGWHITAFPVEHTDNSFGFKVAEHNTIFAYSGDTGFCPGLINLCEDADLAVIECSFPDELKVKGHLSPSEAGRAAQSAHVKRLILTHMYPIVNEREIIAACSAHFSGEVACAEELRTITIGE